jgi:predicted lipoprotein with Yx(FWY)xxD motif
MRDVLRRIGRGGPKVAVGTIFALAGFATAALVGVAIARTFTLKVVKNAQVTNQAGSTMSENIVGNSHGFALYELTGDSRAHPECTKAKGCFSFWPPLTVASRKNLSKASGISGKLGVWRRNGFLQVTLAGHPLYRYSGDARKDAATGEGIQSFGGTWHVVKAAAAAGAQTTSGGMTGTMTTTPTSPTTTTPCAYPPYC